MIHARVATRDVQDLPRTARGLVAFGNAVDLADFRFMQKMVVFAFAGLAMSATATLADGFELTMQWSDSLTVEGTRYTCNGAARGGVAMAPGDRISAGQLRLKCAKRDDGGAPDGPPPGAITVTSAVDIACLTKVFTSMSGSLPNKDAPALADACRPLSIGRGCSITKTTAQPKCLDKFHVMISGSFSAEEAIEVQRACSTLEGSCSPRGTRTVAVATDLACITQLFQKTSGSPTATSILKWFDACRPAVQSRCVVVGAAFDAACYSKVFQIISGSPTPTEAGNLARNCTKLDLRCE
jgi:hypothetical protein